MSASAGHRPDVRFIELLHEAGWKTLDHGDPRVYRRGNVSYATLVRQNVRIALTSMTLLSEQRGTVFLYHGTTADLTLLAVLVDPEHRREGRATEAVNIVIQATRASGCTLWLELAPIGKGGAPVGALRRWYKGLGFEPCGSRVMKLEGPAAVT
ncbi:GNAT family N-acetyltransferase (plasmid) [Flagellatimonas centrodinii]|uniref:GNAT family N-acetyltransferase n=1 Tax=Flagellatimonas centrodinii TaxID=2806210 RepID=UPI001FEFF3B9|nr:GNAT family N-acetyltransferase [Flagellatimonas centrodinii]ULQ48367.1 GNAT family N-acetyltransferase [Flagellatimonas centrodinii]